MAIEARNRALPEWFTRIRTHQVVLPRFQRFEAWGDRKSTRLNSSHSQISYAVFCLKKKKKQATESSLETKNNSATRQQQALGRSDGVLMTDYVIPVQSGLRDVLHTCLYNLLRQGSS